MASPYDDQAKPLFINYYSFDLSTFEGEVLYLIKYFYATSLNGVN